MLGNIISGVTSLIGGGLDSMSKDADRDMQQKFAQQGIRWKVADAKAAGIHPLAALGAQTTSYSPVSIGGGSIGQGLAAAGQDISRAIDSTRTQGERIDAYTKTVQDLNLRRMGLENELLASQIAKTTAAGPTPAMPTPGDRMLMEGQGNGPLVKTSPLGRAANSPEQPSAEAGAVTDIGYTRTPTGWAPVMSKDAKDRLEEDFLGMIGWNMRNRLPPTLHNKSGTPPGAVPLDEDETWYYHPVYQEYRKYRRPKSRWLTGGFKQRYQ